MSKNKEESKGGGGNDKNSSSNRDFKLADGKSLSYVGKDGNSNVYSDIGKFFGSNSYPSGDSSRGGEGGKGGQWGYSGSNSGQTKINPQVAKQITDKISSSESAIQNEIGRLKGLNPIASEETLRSAAIQELGIATFEELLELKSYQNNSISYTSPMQNTQTKIINEFVSKYGSGMNEANVGILLKNVKNISGGEVTGQSKELVKQVYSKWFQNNFGMDTANIKIFNDRCISIFGKPIEIGAFKSTEDLHGSIVSKFTSEYGMDAPNTGILLNKIKSETGAEASKSTKEMIKQKHAQWFVQKYTLDEYNMKILDKSCITLFTSPTNPSTAILKLSNILLDDSHVPYITSMMANNNCPNLIYLDLRDNFLGDYSASLLTASISKGEMPSLKVLHLEGNKLTPFGSNPRIINLVQNVKQDIKILVSRMSDINDGVKKQGNLFFGSKEDKQNIIKDILKQSQDNGVDVKNVTVSKDIFDGVTNGFKLGINFSYGWAKCVIVPDNVKSFVGDKIIAKAFPLVGQINDAMDRATCYFESFDKSASSKEGVQFIEDIGLLGSQELIDHIE